MNMSHCRWHNTLLALTEVQMEGFYGEISEDERRARDRLFLLCKRIAYECALEIEEIETQLRRERVQREARVKSTT